MNKVYQLNFSESDLIKACIAKDPQAEKVLYEQFKGKLFGLCLRYLKNRVDAEDVFTHGFVKIFSNLSTYSGKGSLEGWMKKIMVNECLMELRKTHPFNYSEQVESLPIESPETIFAELGVQEILELIDQLPIQQKTVFNLYVFEDYSHEEIAKELGIGIGGSKSQLSRARKKLQELILRHEK